MTKIVVVMLCVFVITACTPKIEYIKEPIYIPCNIPEIPEQPKYLSSQVRVNDAGEREFRSKDDILGAILNIGMYRFHIDELRNILYNAKEPVKGGTTK